VPKGTKPVLQLSHQQVRSTVTFSVDAPHVSVLMLRMLSVLMLCMYEPQSHILDVQRMVC
jgi:hypothetical protein